MPAAPSAARHLRWAGPGRGFGPVAGDSAAGERAPVLVADSWLVEDGRTRALGAHIERFRAACASVRSVPGSHTTAFVGEALPQLPPTGRWFPRLELVDGDSGPCFRLWVRPAPPRGETVRLWVPPEPDRRTRPAVKGPDLAYLARLRQAATDAGADEAVLLSADGRVREGGTTSILWWRDGTLHAPPDGPDVLPGVTRGQLLRMAEESGVQVAFESPTPHDLDGLEVWAVNALHGIRPVTAWTGTGVTAGPAARAARWHARLQRLAGPLIS